MFPDKQWIYRWLGNAKCVAVSGDVRDYLIAANPKLNVSVVTNGLAAADNEQSRVVNNGIFDIGFVGRVDEQKGADRLFDAVSDFMSRSGLSNIRIHLVGSPGTLAEKLRERAGDLGLPNDLLKFYGYAKRPFALLSEVDMICVPSLYEGFGLVFYEALERNHFVLATDLPAFHAFEWDADTVFFDRDDPTSFTKMLEYCYYRAMNEPAAKATRKRHAISTVEDMARAYLQYVSRTGGFSEIKPLNEAYSPDER
jgi:glycosyltransferase involved in cell wall biosynthesis